ncbi:putative ABC transport system permease protein [Nitrosospira multiformis]|uniref:Putative ABC transport system permease protein n=1 Tax=Nitrosospira multiformis TaxID=1231 RepID=A0A2T5II45_9PROT|nr:ABC transporter permease [Nitrosospira multiformis]PTQ83485.1 putative ABC transport system permease protein [Nitrosospira multiformis]
MFKLALRSVFRQKSHTAMTLVAIMAGVAGLILAGGWVNDVFVTLSEALIHSQSGHLQIYKKGFFAEGTRAPERYLIADPEAVKQRIAAQTSVENVMARLNFSGLLSNGRSDLPIIGEGVEPAQEARLGSSVSIIAGRQLEDNDTFGMLLGQGVAQVLKLKPGDNVTLLANTLEGALNSIDLEVIGVFQSFSNDYDARAIKIPLAAAQELLGTRNVNALVVTLKKTDDTNSIAALLEEQLGSSGLEIKTWVELNDFYEKTVELYKGQFGVLQLVILVMVLLSVANSVNMSIFERMGEFGTMMALGNRSSDVFRMIMIENVLLGVLGSTIGLAIGVALALIISAIGIPMPPPPNANMGYTAHIQVVPSTLLISFSIGILATVLAAVFPARHVSRVQVVEALRQNL